ncbi:MAG: cytochrome c [Pseudomonadota bacterium]
MLKRVLKAGLTLGAVAAAGLYVVTLPATIAPEELGPHEVDLARGEAVFWAGGCASCHAANSAEKLVLAGGVRLDSPYGVFVAPNISSHPEAGIGAWQEADFVTAMLRGTSPAGGHYYPAFPYGSYAKMTLSDVRDLWGFLQTVPASDQVADPNELSFPFDIRQSVGLWKLLFLTDAPILADAPELGRYLVEGPGHCAECHTPRNLLGGLRTEIWMAGAPNPSGSGRIPNITPSEAGIGSWTVEDIAYYLESGFTPDFDSVGGSMSKVVENTARMTPEERLAIAAYLKAIPAR